MTDLLALGLLALFIALRCTVVGIQIVDRQRAQRARRAQRQERIRCLSQEEDCYCC